MPGEGQGGEKESRLQKPLVNKNCHSHCYIVDFVKTTG